MANTIRRRCSSANAGISLPSQGIGPSMECLQATVDRRLFSSTAHGQKPNQISNLIAHFLFFPSLKKPIYIVNRSNKMSLPEPDLPGGRDDMRERESVCVCVWVRERERERGENDHSFSVSVSLSPLSIFMMLHLFGHRWYEIRQKRILPLESKFLSMKLGDEKPLQTLNVQKHTYKLFCLVCRLKGEIRTLVLEPEREPFYLMLLPG